ncbi:MAG TPA: GTP cyclohydrolase II [Caldilineaceae bacterium]|nr:GTP cyclohydrolase II [Caldilineaceae bacterium]
MNPSPVTRTTSARIPTAAGVFQLCHFIDTRHQKEHLALVMGEVAGQAGVLVRVHSECFTGDVLGSQRCDCGEQLHRAMRLIAQEGAGVLIYLRQEGRGIGLEQKLRAYNLQDQGYDTVDANLMLGHQADEREYSAAAAILADLQVRSIRLMTNNPAKIDHLTELGIRIEARVALEATVTRDNAAYLATKVERMRHLLNLPAVINGNGNYATPLSPQVEGQLERLKGAAARHVARTGRPFVTLSYAQSLDGSIGAATGGPLALSGPEALRVTHALRAAHDAILVGIGTVLADDPRLTVRLVEGPDPQPVVVDSHLRLPAGARLLSNPKRPWIAHLNGAPLAGEKLSERGAKLLTMPADSAGEVDLDALLLSLGAQGIQTVMVEGGARIIASLLARRLVHYAVITIAPRFIAGQRLPLAAASPDLSLAGALSAPAYTQAGADLVLWGELTWESIGEPLPAPILTSPAAS